MIKELISFFKNHVICNQSSSFDFKFRADLERLAPHWFEKQRTPASVVKEQILNLRENTPRPNSSFRNSDKTSRFLGRKLQGFTSKQNKLFDADFDRKVRIKFPNWFVKSSTNKKNELLNLKAGSKRPHSSTKIGTALLSYTSKTNGPYDPEFDKAIRMKQPEWFISRFDKMANKKEEILSLPLNSPKPRQRIDPLGISLIHYIGYDKKFKMACMKRFPHWFINAADENKKKLLSMKKGSPRPSSIKHSLGTPLISYTNNTGKNRSYDEDFTIKIKKRFPHWFINTADKKRKELLKLPKNTPKPKKTSTLGSALRDYTRKNKDTYNEEFDRKIRKRFPEWFRPRDYSASKTKEEILSLPLGSNRPNQKKTKLGKHLTNYTCKSSCYDPEFDRKVRARFPHWFS